MSEIYITKNGFRATEWDGEIRQNVPREIKNSFHELRSPCHIEPDVTLKDIINIVGNDKLLSALVSEYSWCDVDAFVREVNTPTAKKDDLDYIILRKILEFWHKDAGGFSSYIDISGAGPNKDKHEHDDRDYVDNWAIELTPVNEMADVPVRLDPDIIVSDYRGEYKRELIKEAASFSLLEVVSEIFFEISFTGSPDSRNEFGKDLKQTFEDVKSGKLQTVPWEPSKKILQ